MNILESDERLCRAYNPGELEELPWEGAHKDQRDHRPRTKRSTAHDAMPIIIRQTRPQASVRR